MVLTDLIETTVCRIHGPVKSEFHQTYQKMCANDVNPPFEKRATILPDISEDLFLQLVNRSLELSNESNISNFDYVIWHGFKCPCQILLAFNIVWFGRTRLLPDYIGYFDIEQFCFHSICGGGVCFVFKILNAFRLARKFSAMRCLTSLNETQLEIRHYKLPENYLNCGYRCYCRPHDNDCGNIFYDYVKSDFYRPDGPFMRKEYRLFGVNTPEREAAHQLALKRFGIQKRKERSNPIYQEYMEMRFSWN